MKAKRNAKLPIKNKPKKAVNDNKLLTVTVKHLMKTLRDDYYAYARRTRDVASQELRGTLTEILQKHRDIIEPLTENVREIDDLRACYFKRLVTLLKAGEIKIRAGVWELDLETLLSGSDINKALLLEVQSLRTQLANPTTESTHPVIK